MSAPEFPPGRYGRRRRRRSHPRWLLPLLTALLIIAAVVGVVLYSIARSPDADGDVRSIVELPGNRIKVTLDVRKPSEKVAVCVVVVRDDTGGQVGQSSVTVPARTDGGSSVTAATVVAVSGTATTAEVTTCRVTDIDPA